MQLMALTLYLFGWVLSSSFIACFITTTLFLSAGINLFISVPASLVDGRWTDSPNMSIYTAGWPAQLFSAGLKYQTEQDFIEYHLIIFFWDLFHYKYLKKKICKNLRCPVEMTKLDFGVQIESSLQTSGLSRTSLEDSSPDSGT